MKRWIQYPLMVSGICLAICPVLSAAPSGVETVKCSANQDRIWVYDSLTSFDVAAKIPCGDTVQIVSRVKGYVKIRTASGLDGYVPDSTFPDLPPYQAQPDIGSASPAAAVENANNDAGSLGAVAAAYRAARLKSAPAAQAAPGAAPAENTQVAVNVAPSAPAPVVTVAAAPAAPAIARPAAVQIAPSVSISASVAASQPAVVPETAAPVPVISVSRHTAALVASTKAKPPVVVSRPAAAAPVAPAAPVVTANPVVAAAAPATMDPPIPAPRDIPAVESAPADASFRATPAKPTVPESDEYPDTLPENASADPNCRLYFSAYGLGAEQYKWLSDARQKQFSGICPAPNLASVDFVILFTHDSDSYISAMPTPVHTDGNGFSDFDPMTTVDTALMSPTEADRAHYELAWVFRVTRGAFDPARFSSRRRPQYESTAKGAHASTKAVEDAFNFIQQNGTR